MTATLAEVREAIKKRLESVAGIRTVYGYYPGNIDPTAAIVGWPDDHRLSTRLGETEAWSDVIPVQLLVGMGDNQNADFKLSAFYDPSGPSSICEAFNLDPTLDGLINGYAIAINITQPGVAQFAEGGVRYLSAVVNIEVDST